MKMEDYKNPEIETKPYSDTEVIVNKEELMRKLTWFSILSADEGRIERLYTGEMQDLIGKLYQLEYKVNNLCKLHAEELSNMFADELKSEQEELLLNRDYVEPTPLDEDVIF